MSRIDRRVLIAGMLLLVGSLLAIVIHLGSAYAEIERTIFRTEPLTGFLLDETPVYERSLFLAGMLEASADSLPNFSAIGLLGVLLLGWSARRNRLIACSVCCR